MDAKQLLRVMQQYTARKRTLAPERYAAMQEFHDVCSGALDAPKMEPGRSPDEIKKELAQLEARSAVLRELLAGKWPDDQVMRDVLGVGPIELEEARQEIFPIIRPIPERLVLMMFDDATIDHIEQAAPILERRGGRGNFFVCEMASGMFGGPGFDDKTRFMTWEQIRELHERGHEIVNHSMHHDPRAYADGPDEYIREEAALIEARCEENGIPRPTAFGYPGGQCTARHEAILHNAGYLWARGDMQGDRFHRAACAHYDPLVDSPLAMPSFNTAPMMTRERLKEVVEGATNGCVAVLAYHGVDGHDFETQTFEEQVALIYDLGGRCITFRQLAGYIDPVRAYDYTHL